jgi:hypothetical protein
VTALVLTWLLLNNAFVDLLLPALLTPSGR